VDITIIENQYRILMDGLTRAHPALAERLAVSLNKQVNALAAERGVTVDEVKLTRDYAEFMQDTNKVLRGTLIAEVHADPKYAGLGR
jgi:hypothetical protein